MSIPDRAEYRLSVLNGHVVSAYTKQPPMGANMEDLRPEWAHQLVTTLPAAVVATARPVARRIGLDYAGGPRGSWEDNRPRWRDKASRNRTEFYAF